MVCACLVSLYVNLKLLVEIASTTIHIHIDE